MSDATDAPTFEPKIVAFFCNWCTYLAADLAGTLAHASTRRTCA